MLLAFLQRFRMRSEASKKKAWLVSASFKIQEVDDAQYDSCGYEWRYFSDDGPGDDNTGSDALFPYLFGKERRKGGPMDDAEDTKRRRVAGNHDIGQRRCF